MRSAENTSGIDGARVAASALAEIDTATRRESRNDVGRRYGAEQVPKPGCGEEAHDAHER
jgi:hypothetical protein